MNWSVGSTYAATDEAVTKIDFVDRPDKLPEPSTHPVLNSLIMELDNYFQGKSSAFATPIQFNEGTPFHQTNFERCR